MSNTEITTTPPDWQTVRETLVHVQRLGRNYILGKVFLGWQLARLKEENNSIGSGRRKAAESATLISWPDLVERETGLKRRAADELIRLFDAALAKVRRIKGPAAHRACIGLFEGGSALTAPAEDEGADILRELLSSVCDGETAASLMQELGIIPLPRPIPTRPGAPAKKDNSQPASQLAFAFFEAAAVPLFEARLSPDYRMLLAALPIHSTPDQPISLSTLEAEARAFLADIERVKAESAKPAKIRNVTTV